MLVLPWLLVCQMWEVDGGLAGSVLILVKAGSALGWWPWSAETSQNCISMAVARRLWCIEEDPNCGWDM